MYERPTVNPGDEPVDTKSKDMEESDIRQSEASPNTKNKMEVIKEEIGDDDAMQNGNFKKERKIV